MADQARNLVFISYSHLDETWLDRLRTFLKPYVRQGILEVWADPYIPVGSRWERAIEEKLQRTAVGVLLVSQNLLASDFVMEVEAPALIAAAEKGLLTLVLIAVSASTYRITELAALQWAHSPDTPLDDLAETKRNHVLVKLTDVIHRAATERRAGHAPPPAVLSSADRVAAEPVSSAPNGKPGKLYGVPRLPPHYLPRPADLARLADALLKGTDRALGLTGVTQRIGLHGQGGIGKSVLAAALVRDHSVRRAFPDGVFWLSFGQSPDILRLQSILVQAIGGGARELTAVHEGSRLIDQLLSDKRCLLVLDDVWNADHAGAFDVLGDTSRLLVTTRDGAIITALGAREERVERLPESIARELLANWAGEAAAALPPAALEVARECGYIPLALSLAGARVRDGVAWTDVLQALGDGQLEFLDHPYASVFRSMRLSFDALSTGEGRRYLELAVFPEDARVPEEMILRLWRATAGLSAYEARSLIARLERKALLERVPGDRHAEISLHDLHYDFIRLLVKDLPLVHGLFVDALAEQAGGDPDELTWGGLPRDVLYPWMYLGMHLRAAGRSAELETLLLDYRWIDAKLRVVGLSGVLSDLDLVPYSPDLRVLVAALHMSAHVLVNDVEQLPTQLTARLTGSGQPGIQAMLAAIPQFRQEPWLQATTHAPGSGLLHTLKGHTGGVNAVAITPDSRHIVSGSADGTLKVWRLETGEEVQTLRGHTGAVKAVAITPDGRYAVSGSADEDLIVWELESGRAVRTLKGHLGTVNAVAITADGRSIVSGSGVVGVFGDLWPVRVWDMESGALTHRSEGHSISINSMALASDAKFMLSAKAGCLTRWNLKAAEGEPQEIHGPKLIGVNALALTSGGDRAIAGAASGTVTVWDLNTNRPALHLEGNTGGVSALAPFPDGERLLAASATGTLRIWSLERGEVSCTYTAHSDAINAVAVSPDARRMVSGSGDETLKIWELVGGPEGRDPISSVRAVAVSVVGDRAASGSEDGTLRIWNPTSGGEVVSWQGHRDWVNAVAFSADGRFLVSGSDDGRVSVWDAASGQMINSISAHESAVHSVSFVRDGRWVVSGSDDGTVRLWDLYTRYEVIRLATHGLGVRSVAVASDEWTVVTGSMDKTVRVWDMRKSAPLLTLPGHQGGAGAVALTSDGAHVITGSGDGMISVWRADTGEAIGSFVAHAERISGIAKTSAPTLVVSCSDDGTSKIWDWANGRMVAAYNADAPLRCCSGSERHRSVVLGCAFGQVHFLSLEKAVRDG